MRHRGIKRVKIATERIKEWVKDRYTQSATVRKTDRWAYRGRNKNRAETSLFFSSFFHLASLTSNTSSNKSSY